MRMNETDMILLAQGGGDIACNVVRRVLPRLDTGKLIRRLAKRHRASTARPEEDRKRAWSAPTASSAKVRCLLLVVSFSAQAQTRRGFKQDRDKRRDEKKWMCGPCSLVEQVPCNCADRHGHMRRGRGAAARMHRYRAWALLFARK